MSWESFVRNKLNEAELGGSKFPPIPKVQPKIEPAFVNKTTQIGHGLPKSTNLMTKPYPKEGDRAYTMKGGSVYHGTLGHINAEPHRITAIMNFSPETPSWGMKNLQVGYHNPIEWDDEREMWFAPLD